MSPHLTLAAQMVSASGDGCIMVWDTHMFVCVQVMTVAFGGDHVVDDVVVVAAAAAAVVVVVVCVH